MIIMIKIDMVVMMRMMKSMMMRDRIEKHREALRGGGWCLEWLHPPPKGIQR
jgi:hypothetical protein